MRLWLFLLLLALLALLAILLEPEWRSWLQPSPRLPAGAYDHDRFRTRPAEHLRRFAAFISSFDSDDDDTGDGLPDTLGIPQWVAYELRRHTGPIHSSERPDRWATDEQLAAASLAPTDDTYRYSQAFRSRHPNWYVRGHLAMKYHAERLGPEAARATHTLLNAVPQREQFNSGIWQDLECRTEAWANQYGAVWIVTGPVFYPGKPQAWLGEPEKGERQSAIPDALFKVVVREGATADQPEVLSFLYPQEDAAYARGPYPHEQYLAAIDSLETLTRLDLLTTLSQEGQRRIESVRPTRLWPVEGAYFTEGCKRSRSYAEASR